MKLDYIIVQAGGKGTRMKHVTRNKPKALTPVNNLPMIFHLFRKFPDAEFIVIGDYKYDVLERYLKAFADVRCKTVNAAGFSGTCAGIDQALELIPDDSSFMLIWSDLVLNENLSSLDFDTDKNYVGTSLGFSCRWRYENGIFSEQPSSDCGVAGLFIFKDRSVIKSVPKEGEFVKWLSESDIEFDTITLDKTKEYGLISEYIKLERKKCRPFNRIAVYDDYIVKEGIDEQGRQLAVRERAWYEKVMSFGFKNLPGIYSIDPLKLERINGKNIYEYTDIPTERKKDILKQLIDCLKSLHEYGSAPFDSESYYDAYIGKTFARLEKVRELVPFANDEYVTVNGKRCRNIFFCREEVERLFDEIKPDRFVFLHGDCTFSNLMLRNDSEPVMIDPRGYFGHTEFFGDPAYDWAKIYYSLVGNYDLFNLKKFDLDIRENDVVLNISSSGWETLEDYFFDLLSVEAERKQIKLIHAIIWLSLTTYAWEDYDSICGAFYNGLLHLEDVL